MPSPPREQGVQFGPPAAGPPVRAKRVSPSTSPATCWAAPPTLQQGAQSGSPNPGTTGGTVQSQFFLPAKPSASGVVWGAGPVFRLPTATDRALGSEKWGIGPTGVVLKIDGQWTYGALANHIWSLAGKDNRGDVSATFIQPFIAYTTRKATTWTVQTETTYDWLGDNWSIPVAGAVSQLVKVGNQPISIGAAGRYWLASPTGGPDWGLRLTVTALFPK